MTLISTLVVAALSSTASAVLQARQSLSYVPSLQNTSSSTACAPLHIIVVRGSTEVPSQGIIGTLADLITTYNPGSSVEWVQYPAVFEPYNSSSYNGTLATTARLQNYVDTCEASGSDGSVVLLGYSQGAHVIGDVMCGGGLGPDLGPYSPPIADKYSSKVIAMVQMGDPRHMINKPFDVGSATQNGIFPRPANISCDKYASILQSYCDFDDPFCAGGNSFAVHLNYTNKYNTDAFNFVQAQIKAKGPTPSSSSNPTGSGNGFSGPSSTPSTSSNNSSPTGVMQSSSASWSRGSQSEYGGLAVFVVLGALFTFGI